MLKKKEKEMKMVGLAASGVLLIFATAGCATAERAPGLDRDKFHISCFSFNAPAQTREHIRQAKECGLDFVCGGIFYGACPEIDVFAEEGLDASVILLPRICGGGQDSDALRRKHPLADLEKRLDGFLATNPNGAVRLMNISDEPGACSMPFLGDVVRLVDRKCPNVRAYVNLFPNYAQASESAADVKKSQLGATSYREYIDEYCRHVPTSFISYDHYPIFKTPERTREFAPRWYGNLKVVADACRRTGRDLWVGPQANSRPGCPPITENHMRYQAFSAMAFGAVDLTWACWTLGWWDHNLMETNGTLTAQYPKLKTVNAEVRALARHYMKLRNVATHFIGFADEKAGLAQYEIVPVGSLSANGVTDFAAEDGSSLVVGEMTARDPDSAVRGFFVYGANDCADEKRATHRVKFTAKGKVRAFDPRGTVDLKEEPDGHCSFDLIDNGAVLLLLKVPAEDPVRVSSLGPDAADLTELLQKALDSGAKKVVVDGRTWVTRPLFIRRSNLELVLADGAKLLAKRGEFKGLNDSLLTVADGCANVTIRGEGRAELEMRMEDYDNPKLYRLGEWRHGLAIWKATNVTVRNLKITRTGGDGIYVCGAKGLTVEDCVVDDCYRLGMGLISAEDMLVRNCIFSNTHGTPPKCGIDLEPNKDTERLVNICFEDCVFEGNEASGALFHLCQFSDRTEPVSVSFRNCLSRGNKGAGYQLTTMGDKGIVRGNILFDRCRSEDNGGDINHFNQCDEGVEVVERDCNFRKRGGTKYVRAADAAPLHFDALKPLSRANPSKPLSTGWIRGPFTFVQWVPGEGRYPLRVKVRQVGARTPKVAIRLMDRLGTDLGSFDVPVEGREIVLVSRGENVYRLEVSSDICAVAIETAWAGGGIRADLAAHLFLGSGRAYAVRVPTSAREVKVNVRPEEPCAATLLNAAGVTVDSKPLGLGVSVLTGKRDPSAADESWRLVMNTVNEDAFVCIGAPCEPILWLTE